MDEHISVSAVGWHYRAGIPTMGVSLIEKVLFLEIDAPSDDEARTIALTMNDRTRV